MTVHYPELQSAAWLAARFAEGKSLTQIARDLGCSVPAVSLAAKRHDLDRRDGRSRVVEIIDTGWPVATVCACGTGVLHARHAGAGRPARLELVEVLPEGKCGWCRGRGTVRAEVRRDEFSGRVGSALVQSADMGAYFGATLTVTTDCPRCGGTGVTGQPIPVDAIALDEAGTCRPLDGGPRRTGEAAHRRHRCYPPLARTG